MQVIQAGAKLVPELLSAVPEQETAGLRPYPADAHPIIVSTKKLSNLYIAVMHSGATLASLVGELVSQEVVSREEAELCKSYIKLQ
jgi:glycine/D-amino acid oxidase-like deaminating enzyme